MSTTRSSSKAESVIIGTRGSALALWQSRHVASLLEKGGVLSDIEIIVTMGDQRLDKPLPELGDKGIFTAELDSALIAGRIDLAIHSLKDLPTELPAGLELVAISERAEPWDVLVARDSSITGISDLPRGAVLGTSSLRRSAQVLAWRSDIDVVSIRGNVETRIRKLETEHLDGVVLAESGIRRLGLEEHISARFDPSILLPAVGQGALGIVAASNRSDMAETAFSLLNHEPSNIAVSAERAFLHRLEGGCQIPVGAYARLDSGGRIRLTGCVGSLDGRKMLRDEISGPDSDPDTLGIDLAERLLGLGADEILSDIRRLDGSK